MFYTSKTILESKSITGNSLPLKILFFLSKWYFVCAVISSQTKYTKSCKAPSVGSLRKRPCTWILVYSDPIATVMNTAANLGMSNPVPDD